MNQPLELGIFATFLTKLGKLKRYYIYIKYTVLHNIILYKIKQINQIRVLICSFNVVTANPHMYGVEWIKLHIPVFMGKTLS
jgi:hypothetical protein